MQEVFIRRNRPCRQQYTGRAGESVPKGASPIPFRRKIDRLDVKGCGWTPPGISQSQKLVGKAVYLETAAEGMTNPTIHSNLLQQASQ